MCFVRTINQRRSFSRLYYLQYTFTQQNDPKADKTKQFTINGIRLQDTYTIKQLYV